MRYEVIVATTMSASVYVEADSEDEAYDMVFDHVGAVDYCNDTCGFDWSNCDEIEEITNVSCDWYIDIDSVLEDK